MEISTSKSSGRLNRIKSLSVLFLVFTLMASLATGCSTEKPAPESDPEPAAETTAEEPAEKKPVEIFSDSRDAVTELIKYISTADDRKIVVVDFYFTDYIVVAEELAVEMATLYKAEITGLVCAAQQCDLDLTNNFAERITDKNYPLSTFYSFMSFDWMNLLKTMNPELRYAVLGKFHPEKEKNYLEMAIFDMSEYRSAGGAKLYLSE